MPTTFPPTRFSQIRRYPALTVLAATAIVITLLIPIALSYQEPPPAHAGDGDLALYTRIVDRLHTGESFYPAAHAELTAGNYGTLSVMNWRTPLYPTILGWFPSINAAQIALALLAAVALAASCLLMLRQANGVVAAMLVPAMLVSLGATIVPGTVLYSEYAAGILILLSAACFGLDWRRSGFVFGILALFFRELAAPYIVICIVLAWREKRKGEVIAWLAGIAAYAAFYFWHYTMVQAQLGPADFAAPDGGWLKLGGATFVLSTATFNGVLVAAPMWISAIVLPLCVLGLVAWPSRADVRVAATVFSYLLAFAFVGKPLNRYWGEMYTPLLTLGLPWAVVAIADLARAATGRGKLEPAG